ncbi:MAG: DUF1080 domain-containing protein [Candidatus Hydrogenedentes bacterium]|nr:DUF1080 domain-containing protein [Candidatus Hydrogenedentota bacterium]
MKTILGATLMAATLLCGCGGEPEEPKPIPVGALTPAPTGEGWINLLDDAHQAGWKNITDDLEIFDITAGVLHLHGNTPKPLRYAGYAAERFGDFDLHVEFKYPAGANSGIFIRMQPGDLDRRGFEVQVQDDFGKPIDKNICGAIYDVVTPMYNMCLPAGQWNSFDIAMHGALVEINLNGWLVIKADLGQMTMPLGKYKIPFAELPREGLLTFQDHHSECWYRNVMIKPAT